LANVGMENFAIEVFGNRFRHPHQPQGGFSVQNQQKDSSMSWKHIFARKDLEMLLAEMADGHRLHRVLGPISLTALGVGCIIGAGIFVLTGVAAADNAGPAIMASFAVAAVGCALAALCYAEFAAMAPVAGSVYTYAYTTLGEIFAWIIGWDLILEYSMGCAAVASSWSGYLNELLRALGLWQFPPHLINDPFTLLEDGSHGLLNLPSVFIMLIVTAILVLGIRESARTNAVLVLIKVTVVLFVIVVGSGYVLSTNWHSIPVTERVLPQERVMPGLVKEHLRQQSPGRIPKDRMKQLTVQLAASYRLEWVQQESQRLLQAGKINQEQAAQQVAAIQTKVAPRLPKKAEDRRTIEELLPKVRTAGEAKAAASWGLLGLLGLNRWLLPIDDATRTPFTPYGLSGIMLGAAIVFFAYIGFDSISTHAEEARNPQRDVPVGIITSLVLCTVLYMLVAAVVTGMAPYPSIDVHAPIAAAFAERAAHEQSLALRAATALIAAGGLAGMTSVLLVLFLSQARVFMAMARDGLLPRVFGTVHPRFRTPHLATMLTGVVITIVAALTPIRKLAEMVNIGTLLAFVMVCAAVLILRVQRPDAKRPFRTPAIGIVAPLGILVNLALMLFLPLDTWTRLVVWLVIGLVIYFTYSHRHSLLGQHLMHEIMMPGTEPLGAAEPVDAAKSMDPAAE
jgi:APA family basic amino acid/polyamine antiporter